MNATQGEAPSTTAQHSLELSELLATAPLSAFHWRLIAMCFAIAAVDGFDTQCISFVAPALLQSWGLTAEQFGPLFSAGLFGTMLGASALGSAADRIGRKPVILLCVALFAVMSLLSATADSVGVLAVYRFIGGVGLGGVIPNIIALMSEYAPARYRATLIVAMFCGFPVGAMLGGAVSHQLIVAGGWEAVFVLGGVAPLVLFAAAFFLLPESARRLADAGRHAELERVLARVLARVAPSASLASTRIASESAQAAASTPAALFREGRTSWTLLLWGLCFLGMLLTYFLINWTPLLLVAAGAPQQEAIRAVVLLNAGGVLGAIAWGRLIDRMGIFRALAAALALGAASVFALGATLGVALDLTLAITVITGLTVFAAQLNFASLAASAYPVSLRSTGVGWAMAIGRLGSVIGPLIGGALVARGFAVADLLALAAAPCAAASVAVILMSRQDPGARYRAGASRNVP